jgi:hypothetical protein
MSAGANERAIIGWSGDAAGALPGSRRYYCALCTGAVWLTASGQRMEREGATVLCIPCAARLAADAEDPVTVDLAPGAAEEFDAEMRRITERHERN